ncbi:hypothetical protein [Gorillibacterium sp. sgz5001074]|uniref:hypothetical protein n=1 Tax=Gorillibacterium sp. sgz5001074 TaxID=3446695 RepID=UPI003F6754A3
MIMDQKNDFAPEKINPIGPSILLCDIPTSNLTLRTLFLHDVMVIMDPGATGVLEGPLSQMTDMRTQTIWTPSRSAVINPPTIVLICEIFGTMCTIPVGLTANGEYTSEVIPCIKVEK